MPLISSFILQRLYAVVTEAPHVNVLCTHHKL